MMYTRCTQDVHSTALFYVLCVTLVKNNDAECYAAVI